MKKQGFICVCSICRIASLPWQLCPEPFSCDLQPASSGSHDPTIICYNFLYLKGGIHQF